MNKFKLGDVVRCYRMSDEEPFWDEEMDCYFGRNQIVRGITPIRDSYSYALADGWAYRETWLKDCNDPVTEGELVYIDGTVYQVDCAKNGTIYSMSVYHE